VNKKYKEVFVNAEPVLTKEDKAQWIGALRSGKYKQGFEVFVEEAKIDGKETECLCCLEVYNVLHGGRDGNLNAPCEVVNRSVLFGHKANLIPHINDENRPEARDYSNIIPYLELLPTID